MRTLATLAVLILTGTCHAAAIDEVNHWRQQNGLPAFTEDEELTAFAQQKAEWRAARLAKNGHQGPATPAGCREGCGEATADWGWLTCCQEETGTKAGAGVAIGADGERYMVLLIHGTQGTAPRGRKIGGGGPLRIVRTAHLTPDAPVIERIRR
ncbi:MAG: CAP domain-containing protein [Planctomycetota bacterium]